jgi:hypothetical protein
MYISATAHGSKWHISAQGEHSGMSAVKESGRAAIVVNQLAKCRADTLSAMSASTRASLCRISV